MGLNEKTLDCVGGALGCRLDTSLCHHPDDNLNQLYNISLKYAIFRWKNIK